MNRPHQKASKQFVEYKSSVSCSTLIWVYLFDSLTCNWYLLLLSMMLKGVIKQNQLLVYVIFVQRQWLEVYHCNL